ncbi:MAG: isoprenylcysteine carboxylmethyltransferase family protein [Candidatus ainarchaeum sp.]|nr:isoprenylcysteine carboxylmethyltransferase family protein [Candidatus ainarchaeum sp.]
MESFFAIRAIMAIVLIIFFAALFDSYPYLKAFFIALFFLVVIYYRRSQLANISAFTKKANGFDDRKILIPFYTIFLVFCAYDFLSQPMNLPITIFGGIVFTIGIYIYSNSVKKLGKFFSTAVEIKEKHRLIQNGPYKHVRHPAYFGSLLFLGGLAIAANSLIAGIIYLILLLPWFAWRISSEEKMLEKEFGKTFLEYKKKTKILIPKLL